MLIGQIAGGFILVFLLGTLIDWLVFKRSSLSRTIAILCSTVAAIVLAVVLYGFGNADGGPWNPGNSLIAYPIGGVVAGAVRYFRADAKGETRRDGTM